MPVDAASAALMHRRYRMYTTRLSEADSELYPIVEEDDPPPRRWPFIALIVSSLAFIVLLTISAAYSQEGELDRQHSTRTTQDTHSRYRFPSFNKNNRFTKEKTRGHGNCSDGEYSKRTLQRAYELPFAALFLDNKGQEKYEASSVIVVDNDVYSVCDSSWAISKFTRSLKPFSPENLQIGDPHREPEVRERLKKSCGGPS